jgi:hypothetical protein
MPIFHSPGGPVEINRCPLKPDKRHFGYAHRCQDNRSLAGACRLGARLW